MIHITQAISFVPTTCFVLNRSDYIKLSVSYSKVSNHNLPKGTTLQNFETLGFLGSGSYAEVSLVKEKSSSRVYALKAISKYDIEVKQSQVAVLREKNILKMISHPFIVQLNYTFRSSTKVYFLLEFLQGGDMFGFVSKRIEDLSVRAQHVKFYGACILMAITHLHSKDILYRLSSVVVCISILHTVYYIYDLPN